MALRFPPTVSIAGTALSADVVIDDIIIRWGRDNLLEPNDPSSAQVGLIDPAAAIADAPLVGAVLTITAGGIVMFRGGITGFEVTRHGDAWRIDIGATDVLADISRDRAYNKLDDKGAFATAGTASGRLQKLMDGGMNAYVNAVEGYAPDTMTDRRYIQVIRAGEDVTWLEAVQAVYVGEVPLGVVYYDPNTHAIKVGRPAPTPTAVVLSWDGSLINFGITGASVLSVDAGRVEYAGDKTLAATVGNAITEVQVNWTTYLVTGSGSSTSWTNEPSASKALTAAGLANRGARVLVVDAREERFPLAVDPAPFRAQDLANAYAAALNLVNDKLELPNVRYTPDRWPADAAVDPFMLRLYPQAVALFFRGSELNELPAVPLVVQAIGGTASWISGWEFELRVVPAAGVGSAVIVSIAQLVAASQPAPEFQDYSPEITLANLGTVTQGVS